jgi:hypothetical protein
MKYSPILFLMLVMIIGLAACSGKESATTDNKAPKPEAATSTTPAAETPSEVVKKFLEAERGRRYSEVRELLSQRSISNLTQAASQVGTNVDQALKRVIDADAANMEASNVTSFETRNENIQGQNATVEVRGSSAPEFARVSLNKEGDRWKINIDETAPAK